MNINEALTTGLREIRTHFFRSVLSFCAIAVGVGSILYTFAQTHGMRTELDQAISLMGPGRMTVKAKEDFISRGLSPGLTSGDAEEIRKAMPELYMVYPKIHRWGIRMYYDGQKVEDASVEGVTGEWRRRDWVYTLRGRFLNSWDVENSARVCVVIEPGGWFKKPFWATWWRQNPLDAFLGRHDVLNKQIRIENQLFTVVGALREPPKDLDPRWFHWEWNSILIPVTTYQRYMRQNNRNGKSENAVEGIEVDAGSEQTILSTRHRIEAILKERHRGEEDYEIEDNRDAVQEELADTKRNILIGTVLGMVALLAGGIGIMNVTLAAIFSRIKEIGIRRAVGATKSDIMAQFVTEAMFLGLSGGLAGLGLGYAGVAHFARNSHRDLANLTWYHMITVVAIGIAISCLFSLYPASQAAALDPVVALKDE